MPCIRHTGKSCSFCWIVPSFTLMLVHQLQMPLCRHPWGHAPTLAGSSAMQLTLPTGSSPLLSHVQKEQEGLSCCHPQQYILLCTAEVGLHFFGGLHMFVKSGGRGGRRSLCFRPTTHLLGKPMVSQALAIAQEEKAVMAGLFWGGCCPAHPSLSCQGCSHARGQGPLWAQWIYAHVKRENWHTPHK